MWKCSYMQVGGTTYVPVSSLNAHRNHNPETHTSSDLLTLVIGVIFEMLCNAVKGSEG